MKKLLLIVLVLITVVTSFYIYDYYEMVRMQTLQNTHAFDLTISKGETAYAVLEKLEQQGILHDVDLLKIDWKIRNKKKPVLAGDYKISVGLTVDDLFDKLAKGDVEKFKLTIIEGWTFKQIRSMLSKQENLKQTIVNLTDEQILQQLNIDYKNPEGLFFPETYQYQKYTDDLDVLKQAHSKLNEALNVEWQNRADNLPYKNLYEALIMASIIEKETGVKHERKKIAGVFVKRLQIGMRLQTDPTVIYGLYVQDRYHGNITRAHLKESTPYNTYVIYGLPPTPIAAAGKAAIEAALQPDTTGNSLYFVAKGDGSHFFSSTLQEHNKAVREYQLSRSKDYKSSPQAEDR